MATLRQESFYFSTTQAWKFGVIQMIPLEPMDRDDVNMFSRNGPVILQIERMKITLVWEI